jgi:RHS repeat-associated protein
VYEVDQSAATTAFTFDANGNLTSDGVRTFEWDARNQLVAVNVGAHRSEFTYDGMQRRVQETEKENTVVQSDIRVLWCGAQICEERAGDGAIVTRRVFQSGEQVAAAGTFFTRDHLASVLEATDGSSALLARYAFDPTGRRILVSGTDVTRVGFTGDRRQDAGGLWFTLHRALDSDAGRWVSEDPLGLRGGTDLFEYAWNNPIHFVDPIGLEATSNWYGNYCGPGGSGPTKDGLDVACQRHDDCYGRLGLGGIKDAMSTGSECKQNCDDRLCHEASDFRSYDVKSAIARGGLLLIFCRSRVPPPPNPFPPQWNPM